MNPLNKRNLVRDAGRRLGGAVVVSFVLVAGLALGQATRPQQIGTPTKPQPIGQPTPPAPPAPPRATPPAPPRATPPAPPRATPPAPAPTRPAVTPAPSQPAAPRATPPAAPRATPPAAPRATPPAPTPRTNPPVQDGTRLAGPAGFGPDGYTSAAMPLTSIGRQVGWRIPPDDFRVFVPQAAAGRSIALEVFSPEVNRNDYANGRDIRTYYGDELYGKNATLTTNFNFKDARGATLVNRTFGESLRHSYERLAQQNLAPGFYPLTVTSEGNGKNSFALRVTNGARIESSQFTVTARGAFNQDQVVGFVQIDPSQLGKTVELANYDADGPTEIVLTLVGPDGKRYPLTASGDVQWATNRFVVSRALVGTWKIVARILPTTRQFSNSFAVRLRVDDQPLYAQLPGFGIRTQPLLPIRCEVVDTSGAAIPGATCTTTGAATRTLRPNLPECYAPVSATILEGQGTVVSPTQVNITSQSGAVRFVATCPAAKVQVNAFALVCGARTPIPAAGFSVSSGATTPATPGITSTAPRTVDVQPGLVTVTPTAIAGSTAQPLTVTAVRGQTVVANLEYTVQTTLSLTPSTVNLEVGGTATLVARAETAFTSAIPAQINVTLPAGLETSAPLRIAGTIASGRPLILTIPVRATAPVANGTARATLEPNCGVTATSGITVTAPPVAPAPPPPPAAEPAQLTLTKTVDRDLVKPGDRPVYTLTVTNTGGTAARGVTLTDTLPTGLTGERVAQTFDLEPGANRVFTLNATVADSATGTLVNTARVTWSGEPLQATAQVRVQPVVDLAFTKSVTPTSLQVGGVATFTMTVTNTGPSAASNVVVSDPLPAGLTYVSSTASQGTASFANNTLTANLGSLARGSSATVTVRVTAPSVGRYTNTATVGAAETETTLENNRASATLEVTAAPIPPAPPPPPALGTLQVNASSSVCGTNAALSGPGFTINGTRYTAPATVQLAPGTYTVQPDAVAGSSSQPVTVTVASNQTATANLVYSVQLALSLVPESNSLRTGETRTLTATASTNFPYPVATAITFTVPAPLGIIRGAPTTTGTVRAGQPLVAVVTVRGLENASAVVVRASLPASCNVTDSATLSVTPTALPEQRRESTVVLLAKIAQLPVLGNALILSDRIPQGATYIAGSSRLVTNPTFDVNTPTTAAGTPINDPFVSGDRLFWVVPLRKGETNVARALREAAARGQITMTRNAQGETVYGVTYRLAHTGALVMPEDRVAVIAAVPARPANTQRSAARIDPASPLGQLTGAGELLVLQGDAGILEDLQKAVPFTGSSAANAAPQRPTGGPATVLTVRVERATTDSIDQPVVVVEAFDKDGLPASDAYATLQTNVDLVDPDADPLEPGYQVALQNGIGRARVQNLSGGVANQSSPPITEVRVEARLTNALGTLSSSTAYRVGEDSAAVGAPNPLQPSSTDTTAVDRPIVAVGTASLGGALDFSAGNFSLNAGLRFALRGSIAPGTTLTVGINWQAAILPTFALSGTLNPPANPFDRFPLLGDSSDLGSDIRSSAGTYAKLEFGSSYVLYGDFNPGFRGVLTGYNANFTGLQIRLGSADARVNAFITDAPLADQRFVRQADGTDLYFLQSSVNPSSERLVITTYQLPIGFTSSADLCTVPERIKLEDRALRRDADYTIDYQTGIVRLRQAVNARDPNGNIQCLEVDYASSTPRADLRYGAQATLGGDSGFSFSATALQFRNGQFGGNSSILLGAGLRYSGGGFDLSVEGANSGVFGSGDWAGAAALAYTGSGFGVRVNYQNRGIGFINPETNAAQSGQTLNAGFLIGDPNGFRLTANGTYTQSYTPTGNPSNIAVSAEARNNFGAFTAGLGLAYQQNLSADSNALLATAGLEIPFGFATLSVLQRVPVIGGPADYGDTTATLSIPLSRAFSLRLSDKLTYEWNGVRQQISFGVSGAFTNSELLRTLTGNQAIAPDAFGQTNVSADYQLDTVNGNAGRARVGFETSIPLSSAFSLQLGGEAVFSPNASEPRGSFTIGGLYRENNLQGGVRAQFSVLPGGLKQVYTAQIIAPLSPEFVISPAVEYAVDPSAWNTPGARFADGGYFSIAFAYRGNNLSLLSNNTGKFGLYSPGGDKIEGEVQAGYQSSEVLYFRSGIAYRLLLGGTFTTQFTAGLQYFLTDSFAIGAQAALQLQPATGFVGYAAGLEGSLKIVDNLLFTVGFNFLGLSNSLTGSFAPGAYFRLDWKIDERTFGIRP